MNMGDPTRSVTPTLDGPVLAVLARAGRPLTVGEVASQAARGSEIGVRRCLARLVDQGLVRATEVGRNRVHELNRDHLAAPVADLFASFRLELWKRLRKEINGWRPKSLYACVFGSAARGDGDDDSDVDLLLVHPPFPGDPKPPPRPSWSQSVVAVMTAPVPATAAEARRWPVQVDRLRARVHSWTGNPAQVVDLSFVEWVGRQQDEKLWAEMARDAVVLAGPPGGGGQTRPV